MHLICTAARKEDVFLAYLAAIPLHRFEPQRQHKVHSNDTLRNTHQKYAVRHNIVMFQKP